MTAPAPTVNELWEQSFVPPSQRKNVRTLQKLLTKEKDVISQGDFRKLMEFVMEALEQGDLREEVKSRLLANQEAAAIFVGLCDLLSCAVRNRVKDSVIAADLARLQFPAAFAGDICKVLTHKREALEGAASKQRITLPTLSGVNWRVDVTISTTAVLRVFKPSVTMQLTLSDGRIRTFECSLQQFHSLRFNVARVLKELQDLESHPTLAREL